MLQLFLESYHDHMVNFLSGINSNQLLNLFLSMNIWYFWPKDIPNFPSFHCTRMISRVKNLFDTWKMCCYHKTKTYPLTTYPNGYEYTRGSTFHCTSYLDEKPATRIFTISSTLNQCVVRPICDCIAKKNGIFRIDMKKSTKFLIRFH